MDLIIAAGMRFLRARVWSPILPACIPMGRLWAPPAELSILVCSHLWTGKGMDGIVAGQFADLTLTGVDHSCLTSSPAICTGKALRPGGAVLGSRLSG